MAPLRLSFGLFGRCFLLSASLWLGSSAFLHAQALQGQIVYPQMFPGSDIGAQINNAYAALPTCYDYASTNYYQCGTIDLRQLSGTIPQTTEVTISSPFVSILGPGIQALTIDCAINGDCWRIYSGSTSAKFTYSTGGPVIGGFLLAGNGTSSANGVGMHVGDIYGLTLDHIQIYNFRGTNGVGLHLDNAINSTERLRVQDCVFNYNTTQVEYSNSGGTTTQNSFGYQAWDNVMIQPDSGQTGISFDAQGATNLIYLYHSVLGWIFENNGNVTTGSNTWLSVGTDVQLEDNVYHIRGEDNAGPGGTSISLGSGAIMTGSGSVEFSYDSSRSESFNSTSCFSVPYADLYSSGGPLYMTSPGCGNQTYGFVNPTQSGSSSSTNSSPVEIFKTYYGAANSVDQWTIDSQSFASVGVSVLLIGHATGTSTADLALGSGVGLTFQTNSGGGSITINPAAAGSGNFYNYTLPALNSSNVNVGTNGQATSGFYVAKRGVSGCTTGSSQGSSCSTSITVNWPTAFPDANYSAGCSPSGSPTNYPSTPYIVSKSAGSMTVNYIALTAAASSWAAIDCWAVHD